MKIEVRKVREHYEVYVNGEFEGSADNYREVEELKNSIKED